MEWCNASGKIVRVAAVFLLLSVDLIFAAVSNKYYSNNYNSNHGYGYNQNQRFPSNYAYGYNQNQRFPSNFGYGMPSYGFPVPFGYGGYGNPMQLGYSYAHPGHFQMHPQAGHGMPYSYYNMYGTPAYGNGYYYHGVPYGYNNGSPFGQRRGGFFDKEWWPLALLGIGVAIPLLLNRGK